MTPVGWFQVAFLSELASQPNPIVPITVDDRRLMAVLQGGQVEIYDAICPHRGASLAHGGQLDGDAIICPFHGYRIRLQQDAGQPLCTRRHPSWTIGDLVFVHLGDNEPLDLPGALSALFASHRVVSGFTMQVRAPHYLVSENAFDGAHFAPVHHAGAAPVATRRAADGRLVGETTLTIPPSRWQRSADADGMVRVPLQIAAFGAGVVVSNVGGADPYTVITTATPQPDGVTTVRLSLAFPNGATKPDPGADRYMIEQSRRGLQLDCAIWDNMDPRSVPHYVEADAAVVAFRDYIRGYGGDAAK